MEMVGTSDRPQSPSDQVRRKINRPQRGSRKHKALTCANCRTRKVRCEGSQPSCKTCEVYGDQCHYDKAPSITQMIEMAKRLQQAEDIIKDLQLKASESSTNDSQSPPTPSPTREEASNGEVYTSLKERERPYLSPRSPLMSRAPTAPVLVTVPVLNDTGHNDQINSTATKSELAAEHTTIDISVDEHGEIQYYGPTSAVHDPVQSDSPMSQSLSVSVRTFTTNDARSSLASHARESTMWEEFAVENVSLQTGIPRQIIPKLLHLHWTWVAPMFMWIYKPAFIRDMAIGGRYYSEFLLMVILAHAAKYQDIDCAEFLLARARQLLGPAIQQPSSIPTVQALLQLSAREMASGSISQAWVYSGIAFRMASDLGLQHSVSGIKGIGPVDIEIRRRLFWSCFFWDKATSLYAGRLPAVTEPLDHSTLDQLQDTAEVDDMWSPYYANVLNLTKLSNHQYPPSRGYLVSCFANSCKLSIIINDVIVHLYSRKSQSKAEDALNNIKPRLEEWRAMSPAHLRYDPESLPAISPPPHIISQNILYFTTVILAHRPFWSIPTNYHYCVEASKSIEKLVLLLESTFGLENITYLMGYCIYTGASAILEDAKSSGLGPSHPILKTFLRALNAGVKRCPLLERSLKIIIKGLNRVVEEPRILVGDQSLADNMVAPVNPWIPAFPYVDAPIRTDFNMNPYLDNVDMNSYFGDHNMESYLGHGNIGSLAALDCFPEMQMN